MKDRYTRAIHVIERTNFPHSVRATDLPNIFIVTLNRKNPSTFLGNGEIFKIPKIAFKVTLIAENVLQIEECGILKDRFEKKFPPKPKLFDSFANLSYVECIKRITYLISKILIISK